jgi:hypothetical protein
VEGLVDRVDRADIRVDRMDREDIRAEDQAHKVDKTDIQVDRTDKEDIQADRMDKEDIQADRMDKEDIQADRMDKEDIQAEDQAHKVTHKAVNLKEDPMDIPVDQIRKMKVIRAEYPMVPKVLDSKQDRNRIRTIRVTKQATAAQDVFIFNM